MSLIRYLTGLDEDSLPAVVQNVIPQQEEDEIEELDPELSDAFETLEHAYNTAMENNSAVVNGVDDILEDECQHCHCDHDCCAFSDDVNPEALVDTLGTPDVTLVAGATVIPCHKNVICNCSEYFTAMFDSQMMESSQEVIELKEVSNLLAHNFIIRPGRPCGVVSSSLLRGTPHTPRPEPPSLPGWTPTPHPT